MTEGEPQAAKHKLGISEKLMLAYLDTLTPQERLRLWHRRPDARQELEALTSSSATEQEIEKFRPYSRTLYTTIMVGVIPYLYARDAVHAARKAFRNLVL